MSSEAVEHRAEAGEHTTSIHCWCKPKRLRYIYDNEQLQIGHWEHWDYDTESWVTGDGEG